MFFEHFGISKHTNIIQYFFWLSSSWDLDWNSALFMILAGGKEEHLNMLDGGIIQRLLEEKWKTFAQRQFMKRMIIAFLHLFVMSVSVYLRPQDRKRSLLEWNDAKDVIRTIFEAFTVLGCLSFVFIQQGEEIKNQGLGVFLKQLVKERKRVKNVK